MRIKATAITRFTRDIDGVFASVPHRHYVSHMLWGDRVVETDGEDRVLRTRRGDAALC
jgi:hypothetical protein